MVRIIKSSFEILSIPKLPLGTIESYGRTCYKSEDKITPTSCVDFVEMIMKRGHESVIEHLSATVRVICDRGVTHEIVRHRIGSYSQESTRYCNYSKDKFGNEITVIDPRPHLDENEYNIWSALMEYAQSAYLTLINDGVSPQMARSVLPNSLKTEIVITYNLREWRHFFKLRCSPQAHPQLREITLPMLKEFKMRIPVIFDDINPED